MKELSKVPGELSDMEDAQDETVEEVEQKVTLAASKPVFTRQMSLIPAKKVSAVVFEYQEDGSVRMTLLLPSGKSAAAVDLQDCILKSEVLETIRTLGKNGLGLR